MVTATGDVEDAAAALTKPVIVKLNGSSSASLFSMLIWPLFVPAAELSNRTENVSLAEADIVELRPSVRVNPVGKLGVPKVKSASPVLAL